jgi:hypothetical protein
MQQNDSLLFQLQQLLSWKKSKKFYAEKLGISEDEIEKLLRELKDRENISQEAETSSYVSALEEAVITRFEEDIKEGVAQLTLQTPNEIKTLDELIEKCKIDVSKWEIVKYVQNYWGNNNQPHWQVKAWLGKRKEEQVFQDAFIEFLKEYQPTSSISQERRISTYSRDACLFINKQDSHLNKYDVDGDNNIYSRFQNILSKVETICHQSKMSNDICEIKYVIGSDEFNSEFTNTTTKGTPQQNILSYHESFKRICDHEVEMISMMLKYTNLVQIIYIPGNHDEYIGWHLINWLQTYFRNEDRVEIESSPKYRKYFTIGNSAIMLNHGDAIKPAKLASIFPIEYKDAWSNHENFYIFTGDKHHEMSHDFGGIKFYQIPAFSNAKSNWDDKNGYLTRGEVTGFLIDYLYGVTNIFKQYL